MALPVHAGNPDMPQEAAAVVPSAMLLASRSARVLKAMAPLAFLAHLAFIGVALLARAPALAVFNVGSCAVYALAFALIRRDRQILTFCLGYLEVLAHAWVATYILGFASGFHIYPLALIPLTMSFDRLQMRSRVLLSAVVVAAYVLLAVLAQELFTGKAVPFMDILRYANFLVGTLIILVLSYYYVGAVRDAEQLLVDQNAKLDALSRTDQLTQLPNRRYVHEWMPLETARVKRTGRTACICVVDVDHFKRINDRYGHHAGDMALRELAVLLRTTLRSQDLVARWGGEEFLIVLPETELTGGMIAMEKLRSRVSARAMECADSRLELSITAGVAELDGSLSGEAVIQNADRAMYAGKEAGRNQVVPARLSQR